MIIMKFFRVLQYPELNIFLKTKIIYFTILNRMSSPNYCIGNSTWGDHIYFLPLFIFIYLLVGCVEQFFAIAQLQGETLLDFLSDLSLFCGLDLHKCSRCISSNLKFA